MYISSFKSFVIIGAVTLALLFGAMALSTVTPHPSRTTRHRGRVAARYTEDFLKVLRAVGLDVFVADLEYSSVGDIRKITVEMDGRWCLLPYFDRLKYLHMFRSAWRGASRRQKVWVVLIDAAGRKIGWATWSKEAVWVD